MSRARRARAPTSRAVRGADRGRLCATAGRAPDEVTLVVVTKFFPAADVRLLADLGVTDVGENRHQEAEAKVGASAPTSACAWHFVGGLQSNKAAAVAAYADVVESVDRRQAASPGSSGAPTTAAAASTCCSRSASTRPDAAGPVRRRPRRRSPRSRPRSPRPATCGCAG